MAFQRIDQLNEAQTEDLFCLYQAEWWTQGRRLPDIELMLQNSNVVVAYGDSETGKLAAFGRVLTDYIYKAFIFDVIVDAAYRGTGLGKMLMDAVLAHPDLQQVRHFELYCAEEMLPFYEKWDFHEVQTAKGGQRFCLMRKTQ